MKRLLLLLMVGVCIVLAGCNSYEPETPHALPYKVISSQSAKLAGKVLCEQYIELLVPQEDYTKVVQENIAHTAMKAAWQAYDSARPNVPDVVVVWVPQDSSLIGKGYLLGKATFAQSGTGLDGNDCPRWKVEAVMQMPSYNQIRANVVYEKGLKQYSKETLKQVLSEKLSLPASQIPKPTYPDSYALK